MGVVIRFSGTAGPQQLQAAVPQNLITHRVLPHQVNRPVCCTLLYCKRVITQLESGTASQDSIANPVSTCRDHAAENRYGSRHTSRVYSNFCRRLSATLLEIVKPHTPSIPMLQKLGAVLAGASQELEHNSTIATRLQGFGNKGYGFRR